MGSHVKHQSLSGAAGVESGTATATPGGVPPLHEAHISDGGLVTGKDTQQSPSFTARVWTVINWMPPWCRWDRNKPPEFSMSLNILFAFAGAFTVANLYYNHPILNILADEFDVEYITVSRVPTLMQFGYFVGLAFICPLGDLFPRRPFTLTLIFFTATLWIGLCVTRNFNAFLVISFITAITTVTPQIMLPLVGELAPPKKRPLALSIVVSGNMMGIVLARILSGIVTQYTSWRTIYLLALGLQYLIFAALWLFMPDYPSSNPDGMNYFRMLWSIAHLFRKHPVLVYAGAVSFCISGAFMNYWTTMTFLLSSPPYEFSSTVIGLFSLIGIAGMVLGPLYAKYIIAPITPWVAVIIGAVINLTGIVIGTYTGTFTVAGPIIQAFGLDAGMQFTQIANRTAIYSVEPTGRNRVNTAFMLMTFLGQLTGTSAGNEIYERGGWHASGSFSVGLVGLIFVYSGMRGPWEPGWIGWSGGFSVLKRAGAGNAEDVKAARLLADEQRSRQRGVEAAAEKTGPGTTASVHERNEGNEPVDLEKGAHAQRSAE
jgi:predicted MFS family arabinose efflux permease